MSLCIACCTRRFVSSGRSRFACINHIQRANRANTQHAKRANVADAVGQRYICAASKAASAQVLQKTFASRGSRNGCQWSVAVLFVPAVYTPTQPTSAQMCLTKRHVQSGASTAAMPVLESPWLRNGECAFSCCHTPDCQVRSRRPMHSHLCKLGCGACCKALDTQQCYNMYVDNCHKCGRGVRFERTDWQE